jgi:exosortase B
MSVLPTSATQSWSIPMNSRWVWGLLAFMAMYSPIYWAAANNGLWQRDEYAHGSIILVITLWMFWRLWMSLEKLEQPKSLPLGGVGLGVLGSGIYVLGRILDFSILEFGSQGLVAAGLIWMLGGRRALQLTWFPLFFLLFMVPLPGALIDAMTGHLKQWVSVIVELVLRWAGYPVGRSGVLLTVGNYQLLVADACSGLHSMFTLSSMGMLLMYINNRVSKIQNALMLLAILPIALVANIIRVMALVLITYHFGDEAGQSFLHGAAGIVMIVIALFSFIALDKALHALTLQ